MANINIGGRLHSTATGNVVAGANEILDDVKGKKQSVINQETDEALASKQAALVSGTNIKTVNGESILGSGNIQAGDPDAIKYSTQTLTDAQKTQARTNIGAYNKPGTGIPATDLASAAQTSLGKADTAYQKPQGGVPKSDLASGVQSSLDLADTAVQAENVGPILPPPETDEFATKTQVTQLEAKVTDLDQDVNGTIVSFVPQWQRPGYYLSREGVPSASSAWNISAPITLKKGQTVIVKTEGAAACIIAETEDGTTYTPLVNAPSGVSGLQTYSYTATTPKTIALSVKWGLGNVVMQTSQSGLMYLKDDVAQLREEFDEVNEGVSYETPSVEIVAGKYIDSNGRVSSSWGFDYTKPFHADAGQMIIAVAAGYNANVAIISKVVTEDSLYTPLVVSVDSTVREYKYLVEQSGDYAVCYGNSLEHSISIVKNTPEFFEKIIEDIETAVQENAEDISSIQQVTDGASVTTPETTEIANKYIGASGGVANANGMAYTTHFYANKGDEIEVYAAGYNTVIAMLSKVVTENQAYTPLLMSDDSTRKKYVWIAQESGYYAASYATGFQRTITIYANTLKLLSERVSKLEEEIPDIAGVEEDVEDLKLKTSGIAEKTVVIETAETNKYIGQNGMIESAGGFSYSNPIKVKAGCVISIEAQGYNQIPVMIARVVVPGQTYIPLVVSVDSTVRKYNYVVEDDDYFAFSWGTSAGINGKIIVYPGTSEDLTKNLYFGIPVVGVIGDSLASGACYNPATGHTPDNIRFAWWKVLERKSGMTYHGFCEGGMSTRSFITNTRFGLPAALTEANKCDVYIIGLGVNDKGVLGPSYLGTASDIDLSNPDNNADTYYGNYAKIIQKITAFNPGCKFLLFTDPRTESNFNTAVRDIASMFSNCYLIDLWAEYSTLFVTGGFFKKYEDETAHYPAMAYQSMAIIIEDAINSCINSNRADFSKIQYHNN